MRHLRNPVLPTALIVSETLLAIYAGWTHHWYLIVLTAAGAAWVAWFAVRAASAAGAMRAYVEIIEAVQQRAGDTSNPPWTATDPQERESGTLRVVGPS